MKAILIDAENKTVTEVEYDGNIDTIYKMLKCDHFEGVHLDNGDCIYVDGEGLWGDCKNWFHLPTIPHRMPNPVTGNGLIVGTNFKTGNSISCTSLIENIKQDIKFYSLAQIKAMNS